MIRRAAILLALAMVTGAPACSRSPQPIRLGAVYPLTGPQAPGGGGDEYRGVRLALDLVNAEGGVRGRPVELEAMDVSGPDGAPAAIDALSAQGIRVVIGSYGTTISRPAASEAARRGMLFWETGAVGSMSPSPSDRLFFRVAPGGSVLGRAAVSFIAEQLAPLFHRSPTSLRFAVANVDDAFGNAVGGGAVDEIRSRALSFAGQSRYNAQHLDATAVIRQVAAAKPDVLFVAAYMQDGSLSAGRWFASASRSWRTSEPPPVTACRPSAPRSAATPWVCLPPTSPMATPSTRPG